MRTTKNHEEVMKSCRGNWEMLVVELYTHTHTNVYACMYTHFALTNIYMYTHTQTHIVVFQEAKLG